MVNQFSVRMLLPVLLNHGVCGVCVEGAGGGGEGAGAGAGRE